MLEWLVVGELAAVGIALAVVFGHALWFIGHRWRFRGKIAGAQNAIRHAVSGDGSIQDAGAALAGLRQPAAIGLVAELAGDLSGRYRTRLIDVAREAGLLAWADRQCRSRRWSRRLRGARLLTLLCAPSGAVDALLADRYPAVRAEAIAWVGARGDPAFVHRLVERLDDPESLPRFAVHDALVRLGPHSMAPIEQYLERHTDGPGLAAALLVAGDLAAPRFLPAASRLGRHPDAEVRRAAANLLSKLGGQPAIEALTEMVGDEAPSVRAAAASGLGALGAWQSAPALARALGDRSWLVRRNAGLALRRLGGPGYLLLRRRLRGDDPYAADMARHVLDLPAAPGSS